MGSAQPIKRVAIIGAGPSGLAAAKYLLAEKCFDRIEVFEQRDNVGGVWNLSSAEETKQIPIPQTNPHYGSVLRKSIENSLAVVNGETSTTTSLELESPMYDYLETNIPKELMGYSDKPFAKEWPLFIGHEPFLKYLEEYAEPFRDLIALQTQVKTVRQHFTSTSLGQRWEVHTQDLRSGEKRHSLFDAVVVASGHYTIPFVPDVKGLEQWNTSYPNTIIHSKAYRKPEYYQGKKVLIVGNSVSGLDICAQIGPYSKTVIHSARSPSAPGLAPQVPWRVDVPRLSEFLSAKSQHQAVRFVDGTIHTGIDAVIFATGYFYNFPFLQDLNPPLVSHGFRTEHLYKHLFYINNPTLVFPVLNLRIIPLPLAENQMSVVARIWAGRLSLPPQAIMEEWEEQTIGEQGDGKDFHLLRFPKDAMAVNKFYNWAKSADPVPGLENDGVGKLGKFWDDRLVWMRGKLPDIKGAYAGLGSNRTNVRTVEELGYHFGENQRQQTDSVNEQMPEHA